jgi:hypothetical protein
MQIHVLHGSRTVFLSLLGYNNDNFFYQLPGQDLLLDQDTFQVAPR